MRKISSRSSYIFSRVFPIIWFGFVSIFVCRGIYNLIVDDFSITTLLFTLFFVFMMYGGYLIMQMFMSNVADEVYDDGKALYFKKSRNEVRIKLSDVTDVRFEDSSPPRIILSLRLETELGKELAFFPDSGDGHFLDPPILHELKERVEEARRY